MLSQEIIETLSTREDLWGIATASKYLASVVPCFDGSGLCPSQILKLADSTQWTKELSEANERLVYAIKEMHDNDVMEKSLREGTDITSGAVLEYDCVLSAKTIDRDGDLLWQKGGMEVDPDMALLWQHIRVQPIGKHVKLLGQTDADTRSRFAIADTELGRDAAILVKFGALRKSHGFVPKEAKPRDVRKINGKEVVTGWEVMKSLCVEGSLVSVPSNDRGKVFRIYAKECDGICTAHSRGLLKSQAVSTWAKDFFDSRPVVVAGGVVTKQGTIPANSQEAAAMPAAESESDDQAGGGHSCTCADHAKNTEVKLTASVDEKFAAVMTRLEGIESKLGEMPEKSADQVVVSLKKIPDPKPGESDDDFVSRCMHSMKGEFPDNKQRVAVCMSRRGKKKKELQGEGMAGSVAVKSEMGMDTTYIKGSWEWIQSRLRGLAESAIREMDDDISYDYGVELVATFAETFVACLREWKRDSGTGRARMSTECYEFPWALNDSGEPEITGEASEVTVQLGVKPKSLRDVDGVIALAMAGDQGAVQALKQASEAHDLLSQQELLAGFMN